jgi:PAS domain S-box-containing protein
MNDELQMQQSTAELRSLRQRVAELEKQIADLTTNQVPTATALQDNETWFRLMQDEVKDYAIFMLDLEGRITTWNAGVERILGYQEAEFIGQQGAVIFTPEDKAAGVPQQELDIAMAEGRAEDERWHCRKDGSHFWASGIVTALHDASGELKGFVKVMRDCTDRKRAETSLHSAVEESQQYITQLQGLTEAALVINSANSVNETLNVIAEQARSLTGAHQAIISVLLDEERKQATEVIASSDKHVNWRHPDEVPDSCGIFTLVHRIKQPLNLTQADLTSHPLWRAFSRRANQHPPMRGVLAAPLVGQKGLNIGLIHVSDKFAGEFTRTDEAVLVQLAQMAAVAIENARLYQSAQEANRIKDEFLSICSHELRTPLNSILGWARLLRSRQFDEITTARALETIERNAETQAQLIEDLLDISRIMSGKLRLNICPVELTAVIFSAIDTVYLAAEAKGIQIRADLDSTVGPILGDRDRLQQIVWNLLSNAIKFTPRGGRVEVSLRQYHAQVEIVVKDTGQGIPPDFLPFIFDRFRQADSTTTRHHGGLGLGLAIVRHLIELHGGTIRADSPGLGQGATFTVSLPLNTIRIEHSEPALSLSTPRHSERFECVLRLEGVRVLVVDDEEDARQLLTTVLKQCGAETFAAASAQEAFQLIQQTKPDVLISDIAMPYEDGYSLIHRIRTSETISKLPAAALTAYARPEDRTAALVAGFQTYLTKPVEPTELIAVVASLTGRTELH